MRENIVVGIPVVAVEENILCVFRLLFCLACNFLLKGFLSISSDCPLFRWFRL